MKITIGNLRRLINEAANHEDHTLLSDEEDKFLDDLSATIDEKIINQVSSYKWNFEPGTSIDLDKALKSVRHLIYKIHQQKARFGHVDTETWNKLIDKIADLNAQGIDL
jgi:predicted KAP-like P-loop ATPase